MSGAERRARQAEIEREFEADMNERHNVPPVAEADRCPIRGGRHSFWTSKKDGKRRCYYCCALNPEAAS